MQQKKSFQNALKWSYAGNWGDKGLSALFTFILAGILGPRDFGMIGICTVYILFLQMFLDQGFVAALIQRKDMDEKHLDAVFWMDLALAAILVLLSLACSGKWAAANHSPEIAKIIPVLSLSIVVEALATVQAALLRREMDFKSLSLRSNIGVLVGGVVGVGMAFAGFRVWSLVGQQIVRDLVSLILLWHFSHWRPRLEFSWRHLRSLMGFSVPNFTAQIGVFAGAQADSILLGLLFGPVAVGLYRIAARVVGSVVNLATASVQAVSFPEFSRLQGEPSELRRSVLTCIRLSAAATVPALAGLAALGDPLMALLGPKWAPASLVIVILSVVGMLSIFTYFTGPLMQALGRPRQFAVLEWVRSIIAIVLLAAAGLLVRFRPVEWQIAGIAGARFVSGAFLVTPAFVYLLMRLAGISLREVVVPVMPSAGSAAALFASVAALQHSGWFRGARPVVTLGAEATAGAAAGLLVLLLLDGRLRQSVSGLLRRGLRRPAGPEAAT
jgi:PST family polysaccharide transporter